MLQVGLMTITKMVLTARFDLAIATDERTS